MPKATSDKQPAVSRKTRLNLQMRETLGEAYAVVMGSRFNEQISSVTLEILMQEQINLIEGSDGTTAVRRNKISEVDRIVESTKKVVEQAKKKHPSEFSIDVDDRMVDENVNTPSTPEQ
jgi:hypothetical protein